MRSWVFSPERSSCSPQRRSKSPHDRTVSPRLPKRAQRASRPSSAPVAMPEYVEFIDTWVSPLPGDYMSPTDSPYASPRRGRPQKKSWTEAPIILQKPRGQASLACKVSSGACILIRIDLAEAATVSEPFEHSKSQPRLAIILSTEDGRPHADSQLIISDLLLHSMPLTSQSATGGGSDAPAK